MPTPSIANLYFFDELRRSLGGQRASAWLRAENDAQNPSRTSSACSDEGACNHLLRPLSSSSDSASVASQTSTILPSANRRSSITLFVSPVGSDLYEDGTLTPSRVGELRPRVVDTSVHASLSSDKMIDLRVKMGANAGLLFTDAAHTLLDDH